MTQLNRAQVRPIRGCNSVIGSPSSIGQEKDVEEIQLCFTEKLCSENSVNYEARMKELKL